MNSKKATDKLHWRLFPMLTRKRKRDEMVGEPLVSLPYTGKRRAVSPLAQI